MNSKLFSKVINVKKLHEDDFKKMFALFSEYYENISFEKFKKDMLKKDCVIMLFNSEKLMKGFSSYVLLKKMLDQKEYLVLFSGDTVIDKDYWGQNVLSMAFFRVLVENKLKNPNTPFYWFLITKGYKTYLLLANNFATYFPRYDKPTDSFHLGLISSIGKELFGKHYDEESNTLKMANTTDRLKVDVAPIEKKLLMENPKIEFFEKSNPNWINGDELCCIGKVDLGLAKKFLIRSIRKKIKL